MKGVGRGRLLLGLLLLLACGVGGWFWLSGADPVARETRRVQKRVAALAVALTFTEDDSPFRRLSYPDAVADFFSSGTELDVSLGARKAQGSMTRGELREGAAGMRARTKGLSVEFIDPVVRMDSALSTATVHVTSKIYFKGDADYWVQEFRLHWAKEASRDGPPTAWRIRRLETVRTMVQ